MLSPAGSFHVYGDRGALVLQSLCIELVGAGADRHEEELGLAFLLEFDLVKRVGLDLQAAGLDLAQPDVVEEVRRDDGVFLHAGRSEEHTSELQSLMRISYAVFCLK